jgi:MarR family transcriptional regulator, repressor for mepA
MTINTEITESLLETARMLDRTGDMLFSRYGIAMTSYEILGFISNNISTTKDLSQKLQTTYSNITHKTKLLEDKGYIKRTLDPKDKRSWNFCLTPAGEKTLAAIRHLHSEATKQLYNQFSEKEKQFMVDFLQAIKHHLMMISQNRDQLAKFVNEVVNASDKRSQHEGTN